MSEKILVFADFHIHNHAGDWRRVDDALAVIDWIFKEAKERQIKKVWFLGDFFHVRGYMYPSIVARSYTSLSRFRDEGIELSMLVGNHDMPYRSSTRHNSITAFSAIANVIEQPSVTELDGWNFYWLPYVESVEKCRWALEKIAAQIDTSKRSALLGHLDIHGAMFHTNIESTNGIDAKEIAGKFDITLTGHYHTHQRISNNVWYVGSPYQQNFGEADEKKGFMIFEDGKVEFVENTFSPKYMYISAGEVNDSIAENYVSITLSDSNSIIDVREKAALLNPRHVTIKIDRSGVEEDRRIVSLKTDAKDVSALLREWVNKTANPTIYDRDKLLNYGISIVADNE